MIRTSFASSSLARRIAVVTALILLFLLLTTALVTEVRFNKHGVYAKRLISSAITPHRKLLHHSQERVEKPTRYGEGSPKCTEADIQLYQGPGKKPLPSGIPTYTVQIMNACVDGYNISDIHVRCGWFSSARLVDPGIFKRIQYDDCLVNGGKPLPGGQSLSFEYANTYSYPLSVSSIRC